MRSSVLDEVHREYIQALRARGLSESRIVWRHSLRNALPPVVALAGVMIRTIVGYSMIVEVIFSWPGLGFQLVNSVLQRDYTLAQMLALLLAAVVIAANFLADVGHHLADPRVRGQGGQA
jgi:peptide/nickel transport system permease protein